LKAVTCIENTSPLFTEYGKFVEMKNCLKIFSWDGSFVKPIPLTGSMAKPVICQEVIVSGILFEIVHDPSGLDN
jgi:hypothetical protein